MLNSIIFVTLFPEQVKAYFEKGIIQRACESKKITLDYINLRDFGIGNYNSVDDIPFGGRQGMLLRADVLETAIKSIPNYSEYDILSMCPKGAQFTQDMSKNLAQKKGLIILLGYYEGFDERIYDLFEINRISIGDFILNSGELAGLVVSETIIRQLPGVLGNPDCVENDSISSGFLEHPQYTQPVELHNLKVPDILRSGHHKNVADFKQNKAIECTLFKRPNLIIKNILTRNDKAEITNLIRDRYGEVQNE
ncbi:tRNA (guanosine(37)-N1)-methyltransferase TrmD [Candidatus Marinamargulisbacteria bacterium SCGC AAA071-K20]|nr:tRNA (guanosine(37)-N1)-methyltransferase TrmD [Candidatus Marinamargulisbacteria bacterium SCGC AAA071-K20]